MAYPFWPETTAQRPEQFMGIPTFIPAIPGEAGWSMTPEQMLQAKIEMQIAQGRLGLGQEQLAFEKQQWGGELPLRQRQVALQELAGTRQFGLGLAGQLGAWQQMAAGMPTGAQIETALASLARPRELYGEVAERGVLSPEQVSAMARREGGIIGEQLRGMRSQMANRAFGMGGGGGAAWMGATGFGRSLGQMRGIASARREAEIQNALSRMGGMAGLAGIATTEAQARMMPTRPEEMPEYLRRLQEQLRGLNFGVSGALG